MGHRDQFGVTVSAADAAAVRQFDAAVSKLLVFQNDPVAEVEHLVEIGSLDKDHIHTPGIFVDRLFQGAHFEKRIERVTTRPRAKETV